MTPTPPTPEPSEQSIGSYKIKRKLGAGGMGEVFLAYDERLRRNVAIKRIRTGASMGDEQRERFRREARAAAAMSHPSIVQVYDIIEEPEGDSIVMEYVEGRTLWDLLVDGELDARTAIDVLLQVADGLEVAHRVGLVHRDLKGENVVVTADGAAKILDFGVAKSTDPSNQEMTLTTGGMAVGTYRSMSPEQCEARPVDARSDLFSLGVMIYEMFGGRTPFQGKTPLHTLANVIGYTPPSILELNGSVPEALSELVDSLLAKDPDERPASAAAVAEVIEDFQDPAVLAALVMPRLTATPDSGIDPIGSVAARRSATVARRRKTTKVSVGPKRFWTRGKVLGSMVVLGAAAAAFLVTQDRVAGDDPSRSRIMVFPLAAGGGDVPPTAGEDVATMIGTALDGTDPLRWIDAWPLMSVEARESVRQFPLEEAIALARARQCGFFIDGRVTFLGDSASVTLYLRDADSGDEVERSQRFGPKDEPWRAGLAAMNDLLPALIPTTVPDIEESFAARPPDAVAQFLLGERAFRRTDAVTALGHFQRAFELDPTFALAGIRGAAAAGWNHNWDAARDLARATVELPLSPRLEALARGILGFVEFDADAAVGHLQALVDDDSTLTVAWAALGEVYAHRAPRQPWTEPRSPFERAIALDSLAANVLFHRLQEVIRDGDVPRADVLLRRFRASSPERSLALQVEVMLECQRAGPASSDWTDRVLAHGQSVAFAATQLLVAGANLPCAEALYRAVLIADTVSFNAEPRYWSALLGLTGSKLAQKDFAAATRLIRAAGDGFDVFQSMIDRSTVTAAGVTLPVDDQPWTSREVPRRDDREIALTRWSELAILVGAVYPGMKAVADEGAADIGRAAGPDLAGVQYRTSLWMLGLWAARNGRSEVAAHAVEGLRAMAEGRYQPTSAYTHRLADALDAHRVLADGDVQGALARFRGMTTNAPEGTIAVELLGPLPLERLALAHLEEAHGDPAEALRLVQGFDEPSAVTYIVYLPPGLATCVRTATQLGQTAQARACQARLTELGWSVDDLSPIGLPPVSRSN